MEVFIMSLLKKSMLAFLVAGISCGTVLSMNDGFDQFLLRQMHEDIQAAKEQAELAELVNWEMSNPGDFTFQIPGVLTYAKHYATVAAQNIQTQATNFWSKLPSFNTVAQSIKDFGLFAKAKAVEKRYVAAGIAAGTAVALGVSIVMWKKLSKPKVQPVAQERAPRFRLADLD